MNYELFHGCVEEQILSAEQLYGQITIYKG